ncbi:MAG: Rpn family recombination-promoting nuclease/putative transposase, partial [Oscillospiraceae bacterium]|nr:Rpn family recombination-promoting nuclease/putative transposase [Oscillospiraceae bacterium]
MTKLKHTFKTDTLFKILFVKYPDLLKHLIAQLLGITPESISEFAVTNADTPPETYGEKFCRLDVNMLVDGQRVDLEVQVDDEGDYKERSLYYWARAYSSALSEGGKYNELPRAIIISIVNFALFDCEEYHSEFRLLEVTRRAPLTDKQVLHFFELPKLPDKLSKDDGRNLWLALFKADTEEDLARIKALEVPIMEQAINAYHTVVVSPEFAEAERLRSRARHDEAQALWNAERKANEKWQGVVAEKDALIAELRAQLE